MVFLSVLFSNDSCWLICSMVHEHNRCHYQMLIDLSSVVPVCRSDIHSCLSEMSSHLQAQVVSADAGVTSSTSASSASHLETL